MPYDTRICENCGKEYEPKIPDQKYCCKACRQDSINKADRKRRAEEPAMGICKSCGKEFVKLNGNQKFCCEKCKKESVKKSKQKYRKRNELLAGVVRSKTVFVGYDGLAESIVFQAIADYQDNLLRVQRHPDNKVAAREVHRLEKFYRSRWYGMYVSIHPTLAGIDPETVIHYLRKGVEQ